MQTDALCNAVSASAKDASHNHGSEGENVSAESEAQTPCSVRVHQWFILTACTLTYTINGGIYFTQGRIKEEAPGRKPVKILKPNWLPP